ncbi:hypothetical protein NDU88_002638 [Pleurodeles waltl]|uniref:Uncharacterized protein n=1 Tax=Pleurodeles waltl TaxID=8319 RepID=A0AAV7Q6K9_PLEWA|nr:hypothetical protein NDU88_002638 [Pleurodeles waltl]
MYPVLRVRAEHRAEVINKDGSCADDWRLKLCGLHHYAQQGVAQARYIGDEAGIEQSRVTSTRGARGHHQANVSGDSSQHRARDVSASTEARNRAARRRKKKKNQANRVE